MKSERFLVILIVCMTVILGLLFLTQNNSDNANYPTKTFAKNNITFDYPENWQDYTEKANKSNIDKCLAAVGDPNTTNSTSLPTTSLIVTKTEDTANSTGGFTHPEGFMSEKLIESWVNTTKTANMMPNYLNVQVTTRNFTLNGLKAYEFTYTGFHTTNQKYEYMRLVAFEKEYPNKKVNYVIICATMASDIGKTKAVFSRIINNFKVQ